MSSQAARCTLAIALAMLIAGTARAADPTEADRRADAAALSLMQRTGFLQIAVDRQAVSETTLDDSLKKQVDAVFARMDADLRPLIAGAQTDPDTVETLVRQGRRIVSAAQEEVHKLVGDDQYEQVARRTRLVQIQLMAITAGPHTFDEARAALQLTAAQQKQVDELLNRTGAKVRRLTDSLTDEQQMVPSAEQLVTVALQTRKQLRAILTEEQLKTLDESTNLSVSQTPPRPRGRN